MPQLIVAALTVMALNLAAGPASAVEETAFRSHPPMRAPPSASKRPMDGGPAYFVDAVRGDDGNQGSQDKPWKSVDYGAKQLKPGDTLCLRGGTYYETVTVKQSGSAEKPIVIRSHPGELAIIDGGYREFFEDPANSWEPVPGGAEGEFRSKNSFASGGGFGHFGDSMVPFHRYMTFADLRSTSELYRPELNNRADDPTGIYCGPGVRRDPETGRIHIRLSHTTLDGLGESAYRGETDPRKLPLVIAGDEYTLTIQGAKHVRLLDLVVRGAKRSAVRIEKAEDIELDGVTLFGGQMAIRISGTQKLRLVNSVLRGHAAPWHSRFIHKNRAGAGYLVIAEGNNADFVFDSCEFTDNHDALLLGHVEGMELSHSLIDNFNDDGIELGEKKERGQYLIHHNLVSRCLNPFTAHGKKPNLVEGEKGSGAYVFRNIVDLRRGTYKSPPGQPDPTGAYLNEPTTWLAHDHGSPTQPMYYVYHNTFLLGGDAARDYYAFTWSAHMRGTTRRVFNNIFVQVEGLPGLNFYGMSADDDFTSGGNLLWGVQEGPKYSGDFFADQRRSRLFLTSDKRPPPGWAETDLFADPKFVSLGSVGKSLDARLQPGSPAIDAGVELPASWPGQDKDKPDLGALPLGAEPFQVGPKK